MDREISPQNSKPSGRELYELRKEQKEEQKKGERRKEKLSKAPKKIGKYISYALIIGGIVGAVVLVSPFLFNLPPTTIQGHIEQSPPNHIVDTPIPENIQKHMLEHADGGGAPGIIIQYNCSDFYCVPDLVNKLTELVNAYPENVYLGPNNYNGKIILTKFGKREVLEEFDEQAIRDFIEK